MAALLAALKDGPHTLLHLAGRGFAVSRLEALVKAGAVEAIGLTPTDILCAEGQLDSGCYHTARLGTEALARCMGLPLAALFPRFHTEMTRRLAEACLQALASFETRDDRRLDHPAARYFLDKALGLATPSEDKLAVTLGLCRPIVAVGAPAAAWMAPVAATLHTSLATPPYAGVACAIGAAVGNVAETVRVLIRPDPATGDYILHGLAGRQRCQSLEAAKAAGLEQARHQAKEKALAAGCPNCGLAESCKDIITDTGRPTENYVETHIQVTAYGPAVLPQEEEPPRCP